MGVQSNYDPFGPTVSGLQWVPIVPDDFTPDQSIERGYTFNIASTRTINHGKFTVKDLPTGELISQVPFMSLYYAGQETSIGQIRKYVVPVSPSGNTLSGATASIEPSTATIAQVLASPSDQASIRVNHTPGIVSSGSLNLRFDTSPLSLDLAFARVLNVSFLYTASGDWSGVAAHPGSSVYTAVVRGGPSNYGTGSETTWYGTGGLTSTDTLYGVTNAQVNRISLGEISPFWSASSPQNTRQRLPWRQESLAQFDESIVGATSLSFHLAWYIGADYALTDFLHLSYAALEITVCEENRLFYGGVSKGGSYNTETTDDTPEAPDYTDFVNAPNTIIMRSTFDMVTGGSLSGGAYTVTVHNADIGDMIQVLTDIPLQDAQTRPKIAAMRELYQIPTLPGVEITRPLKLGDTCEVRSSHVIPSIGITPQNSGAVYDTCVGYSLPRPVTVSVRNAAGQTGFANSTTTANAYARAYARVPAAPPTGPLVFRVVNDFAQGLSTSTVYATGSIAYADFINLPEIADGWREVTLSLTPRITFSSTTMAVRFDSDTTAGAPWEILTAYDMHAENQPYGGSNYATAFYPLNTGIPNGVLSAQVYADIPCMISAPAWPITGILAFPQTIAVTGVALECSSPPNCIPTGVGYNRVIWSPPADTASPTYDEFERSVSSGWGTTTSGTPWSVDIGSSSDYYVADGRGYHVFPTGTGVRRTSLSSLSGVNYAVKVLTTMSSPVTGMHSSAILLRSTGANTYYSFSAQRGSTGGHYEVYISRVVSGSSTTLATGYEAVQYAGADAPLWMHAEVEGAYLRCKIWLDGTPEPANWSAYIVDTSSSAITGAGTVSLESNTLSVIPGSRISYDRFRLTAPISTFGAYELQRTDTVDNEWQTIMLATDPGVTSFNDFEARVGVASTYRVRTLSALNFPGDWSPTPTATIPAPGVTGASSLSSILIFTTNAVQSGTSIYAAPEVGDAPPDFTPQFREDGQVTYQDLFQRDYVTAFHGTERGGVTFTTALLENDGVVNPAALNKSFTRFRNIAWDGVPYICVRTSDGDRWYANVRVSSGTVRRRSNTTSIAQAAITEVSRTPYPVDPAWPFPR